MRARADQIPPAGRHIGRALVVALVVAALAALGASRLAEDSTATSRVAVSDEVGWPFYTSARDNLLEVALDPDVQDTVRRAVGADDTTLELGAATTGGEISVDLTVRSADAALAAEAANLYATEVVERGAQGSRADAEQRVAELQAELEDIEARTAANESELLRIGTLLDEAIEPSGEGSRLLLESQIRRIDSALAEDARRRTQIVQDLPSAATAVDAAASDYEFVRAAQSAEGDVLSDVALMALLAGVSVFLIGLGASVLWDQTLGVVRRPRDVRWATDAPVIAIDHGPDDRIVDPSPLTRRLVRQQIPGSVWMVAPVGRGPQVVTLSASLADAVGDRLESPVDSGRPGLDRPEPEHPGSQRPDRPVGAGRPEVAETSATEPGFTVTERAPGVLTEARSAPLPPRPGAPTTSSSVSAPAAAVSGALVALVGNGVRLPQLRRAIQELELEGMPVEGVVIFGPER